RRSEGAPGGVGLQLVDPPDEAGAVEAAARRDAEERLLLLARPTPDVREADEREGGVEDALLPRGVRREGERRRGVLHPLRLVAGEREDAGGRERRLGAGRRVAGQEFERVLLRGMVDAEAEHARDDLAPEA